MRHRRKSWLYALCSDPRLIGFPTAWGPVSEYNTKVLPQLLNNCESWLGIADSDIQKLQDFQDNYILKFFQVSAKGTPKGMLMLDSQILSMKWRIKLEKIRAISKTMGKTNDNLCKRALIEGRDSCNGEDLLSLCTYLNVQPVTMGKRGGREMCELKKAIWRVYNAEIQEALSSSEKVKNITIPNTEKERKIVSK